MKNQFGHLYFIHSYAQNAVKVGFAANVKARVPSLQSGNPAQLTIGTLVPIESDAERALHDFLKPHRLAREWYPADTLMFAIECELVEAWADLVMDKTPEADWREVANEAENPTKVYLTAQQMRLQLRETVDTFFTPVPEEGWDARSMPTNHWAPRGRTRA